MKHPSARSRRCDGSVAVELAFVVPVIALIVAGIADFGTLATRTDALAAATRIGGEYAKQGPACQSGIQVLSSPPMDTACRDAIQTAMTGSMTFSPALDPAPSTFPIYCECNDSPTPLSISCSSSCATQSPPRPGPKRVFVTVSASQSFTPMIPWPGAPTTLNSSTDIRIQ
jgi:Flp pilus assembly protein TadG